MQTSIRTLALGIALTTALASLAHAGGSSARVEGPFKDGSYAVRTAECGVAAPLSVTASAEGVVNGERKSLPISLKATKQKGVYRFTHTWPADGTWLVRLTLNNGHGPATLAAISSDGKLGQNEFLWDSDGRHECDQKLAANVK